MTATFIFTVLALAAAGFMVRFFVAICGAEGREAQVALFVQPMPQRSGPAGAEEKARGRGAGDEKYVPNVVPIDVVRQGRRRAALRAHQVHKGRTVNGD